MKKFKRCIGLIVMFIMSQLCIYSLNAAKRPINSLSLDSDIQSGDIAIKRHRTEPIGASMENPETNPGWDRAWSHADDGDTKEEKDGKSSDVPGVFGDTIGDTKRTSLVGPSAPAGISPAVVTETALKTLTLKDFTKPDFTFVTLKTYFALEADGLTVFHRAVQAKDLWFFKFLQAWYDKQCVREPLGTLVLSDIALLRDRDNKTLLHHACAAGALDIIKILFGYFGEKSDLVGYVNTPDAQGYSALYYASDPKIITLLCDAGVRVNHDIVSPLQKILEHPVTFNPEDMHLFLYGFKGEIKNVCKPEYRTEIIAGIRAMKLDRDKTKSVLALYQTWCDRYDAVMLLSDNRLGTIDTIVPILHLVAQTKILPDFIAVFERYEDRIITIETRDGETTRKNILMDSYRGKTWFEQFCCSGEMAMSDYVRSLVSDDNLFTCDDVDRGSIAVKKAQAPLLKCFAVIKCIKQYFLNVDEFKRLLFDDKTKEFTPFCKKILSEDCFIDFEFINDKDTLGCSFFHYAAQIMSYSGVFMSFEVNLPFIERNNAGKTPIDYVFDSGNSDFIQFFFRAAVLLGRYNLFEVLTTDQIARLATLPVAKFLIKIFMHKKMYDLAQRMIEHGFDPDCFFDAAPHGDVLRAVIAAGGKRASELPEAPATPDDSIISMTMANNARDSIVTLMKEADVVPLPR